MTKWTEEEEEWLRDNWESKSVRRLVEESENERSYGAIRKKARRMGLPKKEQMNERAWTEDEMKRIKENYSDATQEELEQMLENRSVGDIHNKASELGLVRFSESPLSNGDKEFITVFKEIDFEGNELKLVPLGDIHLGHPACNEQYLKNTLEKLENDEKPYRLLLMGDIWEGQTKNSANFQFETKYPPQKQYENSLAIFENYSDKILGSVVGNHEQFAKKITGAQKMKDFCRELEIPFLKHKGSVTLNLNGIRYKIVITHGNTGSRKWGGKVNAATRLNDIMPDADIYCYGHTHARAIVSDAKFKSLGNGVVKNKRFYALTGSFLEYPGTYADRKNYSPSSLGTVEFLLRDDEKDIRGII